MEQQFYRDEFEQLLKDTTDDFKMYPSRKVWHSIYNDLHPDRKWPSFAVCLFLLTIILYVGVSNNNAINSESRMNMANSLTEAYDENLATQTKPIIPGSDLPTTAKRRALNDNNLVTSVNYTPVIINGSSTLEPVIISRDNSAINEDLIAEQQNVVGDKLRATSFETGDIMSSNGIANVSINETATAESIPNEMAQKDANLVANSTTGLNEQTEAISTAGIQANKYLPQSSSLLSNKIIQKDTRELEWIEDFAFYNASNSAKKSLKGLSTQFYITPSVGYRVKFKNAYYKSIDNALVTSNTARNSADKTELNQQATMNMEAGAGILKNLGKRWRFKTGVQFNATDYLTYAQKLEQSTETNLIVDNQGAGMALVKYSADYAHIPGKNNSKLHNRTVQLSIPIGMDYKIISNNVLNWYVGASVQPNYVTRGNSYLLSSDYYYLVEDQSLISKWNLSGAIESFVSIKTKSGTFINLGPQFRYQLFSTYNKSYIYTEKPYNVGFKIGFTRPL